MKDGPHREPWRRTRVIDSYGCASVSFCARKETIRLVQLTCAGISLFFAARGIAAELRRVRELTEITHQENEDRMISEGTEDGKKSQLICT